MNSLPIKCSLYVDCQKFNKNKTNCLGQTSILVHGSLMMGLSLFGAFFLKPPPEVERKDPEQTGCDVTDASHPR